MTTRSYDLSTQLFRHQQGFCWTRAPLVHQASPGRRLEDAYDAASSAFIVFGFWDVDQTLPGGPTNRATRGTSSLPPGPSPSGRLCHCAALSSADAVYPTSTTSPRSARRLTDIVRSAAHGGRGLVYDRCIGGSTCLFGVDEGRDHPSRHLVHGSVSLVIQRD